MSCLELKQNEIHVKGCGTEFINGVYIRLEPYQFTKQCIHPYSNKIITLQIRKQTQLHSLSIPQSLYNKDDEIYVISCINPCIHYFLCIVSLNNANDDEKIQWISVAGLQPLPIIAPINNIKTYFDIPFIDNAYTNYNYNKIKIKKGNINTTQLVVASSIHSHFKRYKAAIKSSWIELGKGLKGGQCLKIEINRKCKIWDILLEISSMNNISPWNIRLKHIDSHLYVHYLWHHNFFQIIQLIENKQLNKDILNNKFVFYSNKYFICYYSQYDETYSYQPKYLPCYDNVKVLQNIIDKHEECLSKNLMMVDTDVEEKVVDDRYKHKFIAQRIWDKKRLNIYYGNKKQCILLEDCSVGCQCWNDDIAGCRIAYIIQHIFNIPIHEQGWIVNSQIIDYFDENAGKNIFQSQSNLILYSKLK